MSAMLCRWDDSDFCERVSQTRMQIARTLEAYTAALALHARVPAAIRGDECGDPRIGPTEHGYSVRLCGYKAGGSRTDDSTMAMLFGSLPNAREIAFLYSGACEALRLLRFLDPNGNGVLRVDPATGAQALRRFTVIFTAGRDITWQFFHAFACDADHAEEQCRDAEPCASVLWVNEGLFMHSQED